MARFVLWFQVYSSWTRSFGKLFQEIMVLYGLRELAYVSGFASDAFLIN